MVIDIFLTTLPLLTCMVILLAFFTYSYQNAIVPNCPSPLQLKLRGHETIVTLGGHFLWDIITFAMLWFKFSSLAYFLDISNFQIELFT